MPWRTLEQILAHPEPPAYRAPAPRARPKLGPHLDRIARILKEDPECPRKQRHTAQRISAEGSEGGSTAGTEVVRDLKRVHSEVFVPLIPRLGAAHLDFGYAPADVAGRPRKVAHFVLAWPHSDVRFVQAFEREGTETYLRQYKVASPGAVMS